MKRKKISALLALIILISNFISMPSFGQTMKLKEGKNFDVTITSSNYNFTNRDIMLTIIATDEESGVKEIILPDGTKIPNGYATYVVTENGSYTFKAVDNAGNEAEETIMINNIDKTLPTITIEPYNSEPTNENITVHAKVDKGTLNQDSYTFTENGSFTFIATDEHGNTSKKTVIITNIDKSLPTKGKIKIIAINEDERIIETILKENLGLGVQVITAPDISGYKLTSTSVITVWLKPNENQKEITFTYKLDPDWKGWDDAERAVEEAEKKVEEAEKRSTEKTIDQAQKKIDEARDIVEKLPESKKKDELNKKLDELQDRLDKIVIPKKDSNSKDNDRDRNKTSNEIIIKPKEKQPETKNIPLDKFIARWLEHESLSQKPILIEKKSKASYEIDKKDIDRINQKGLYPRFYKWNKEKEKWIALATKVDKDKIETYKEVEGYVAAFAVKQPTFSDIKGNEWYAEIVDRANGFALVEGYTLKDESVILKPHNTISKSELYAMVGRLFGAVEEGQTSLYKELDYIVEHEGADWYKPYFEEFRNKGIIDVAFDKEQAREEITRLEVVQLLTKIMERVEDIDYINLKDFKDIKDLEDIKISKIIDGYEDGTLRLNNKITRVEVLTLIINTLEKLGW